MEEAERLVAPVIACLRHAAVAVQRVPWGGPLAVGVLVLAPRRASGVLVLTPGCD
eukprot:COSAG06_NODE_47087_length_342_cov_0.497942_2_plen_55_part_00